MRSLLVLAGWLLYFFPSAHAQLPKMYIQPKSNINAKQSQFIDSIRFTTLQYSKDVKISEYFNVELSKKYILLNDYSNQQYLIFSKEGVFIKRINFKNLGGTSPSYDEYKNRIVFFGKNKNYTLTTKDEIKIKLDWTNPKNKKYYKKYIVDLDDPSLRVQKATLEQGDIIRLYHYYDDYYWQGEINTSSLYQDSINHAFKIYRNNQVVSKFFPYDPVNETIFQYTQEYVALSRVDQPYNAVLTRPYCDTIYRIIKDSIYPLYQIVLPLENSLPKSFFSHSFRNKTDRENYQRNNGWLLWQIFNFYETSRFVYLSVRYLSNYDTYVYQKETGTTYKIKNIKPDATQYDMTLLSGGNIRRNGEWFYRQAVTKDLVAFFEKNKTTAIPAGLEKLISSKENEQTPVIVEFRLKQ